MSEKRSREARLRDVARRIFGEGEGEEGEPGRPDAARPDHGRAEGGPSRHEARDLFAAFLETGDKAKTEIVRMVAREVRGYLEALELHKDLHHLLTNYSLEVSASFHLKPLHPEAGPSTVRAGIKPRPGSEAAEDPGQSGDSEG